MKLLPLVLFRQLTARTLLLQMLQMLLKMLLQMLLLLQLLSMPRLPQISQGLARGRILTFGSSPEHVRNKQHCYLPATRCSKKSLDTTAIAGIKIAAARGQSLGSRLHGSLGSGHMAGPCGTSCHVLVRKAPQSPHCRQRAASSTAIASLATVDSTTPQRQFNECTSFRSTLTTTTKSRAVRLPQS
jgi:hypothetical protein